MGVENLGNQPEFDPAALLGAIVRCRNADCGAVFVCTPVHDYYGSQGKQDGDGVFIDGQCEPCMLADAGV